MKRFFKLPIPLIAGILLTAGLFAQSPEKMSYQAVLRNSSDQLITNKTVGVQISILQGSASGTAVYIETQTPTSNENGLISMEIGSGSVITGTFGSIDWSNGPYFLKTETDPQGGSTYTITGTSQLLSVPYALCSKGISLPFTVNGAFAQTPFSIENTGSDLYTIKGTSSTGYGLYGKTSGTNAAGVIGIGTGSNLSSGIIGNSGEGTAPSLPGNTGVLGQSNANIGVAGTAISGIGGNFSSQTGLALKTAGNLQFTGIGESAGKILTSDANGNASWQEKPGISLPANISIATPAYALTIENTQGSAIAGLASANNGSVIGVYGKTNSNDGIGVYGEGTNEGVRGIASNASGIGVHGIATTGSAPGVVGEGYQIGLKGITTAANGTAYAVYARTTSTYGFGIYAESPYVGVYGSSTNATGWAGYFTGRVGISGNLGIGTAYPSYPLEVAGTANLNYNTTTGVALRCNGDETIWYNGTYFSWGYGGTYNYFGDKVFIGATVTDPGTNLLVVNGTAAKPGGGSWSTWSDSRLKDIKGKYERGLEDIVMLQPVEYSYKKDNACNLPSDKNYVGFVAQDVQKIFPEAVNEEKSGYLTLDMNSIDIAVINALKELKSQNDKLKAENDELKARLDKLEKAILK